MKYFFFLPALLYSMLNPIFSGAQTPGDVGSVTPINSYTAFQGYDEDAPHLGQGEYQIYYDNIDGVLDKPIIILDGFDPNDDGSISDIYDFLVYNDPAQNYLDELRDTGIDIVILNFPTYIRPDDGQEIHGGADYIERNGLLLVQLIETIKSTMTGGGDLVVVGPSMGGLISRYALTYMEQNGMDSRAGLWISFDAPQLGANIPISFQYVINYMAELTNDAGLLALRDVQLNAPAAKQMLLDHYTTHLQDGSAYLQDPGKQLPEAHAFRTTFMNTMNTMGYPTRSRNISIANGSFNATNIESPGALILDTNIDVGSGFGADLRMHFTPDAGITNFEVDYAQPTFAGVPQGDAFYAYAESPSYTAGLDSAPGGSVLFESLFGENPSDVQQQVIDALQVDAFSFIPTLSSLGIDENNWYNPIDGSESIPFDDYYGNDSNEQHLTLTQESIDFINAAIEAAHLGNPEFTSLDVQLMGNPVTEQIVLSLGNTHNDTHEICIYNSLGKRISKQQIRTTNTRIVIPAPNVAGVYMLSIRNDKKEKLIKFIVKP